jgi:hypothetical protein
VAVTASEESAHGEIIRLFPVRYSRFLIDLLEPSSRNVLPEFDFVLLLTWPEYDHFLNVVGATLLGPNLRIYELTQVIALVDKRDEVFLPVNGASTLSFTLFNVTIEEFSHSSIIVERCRLIQSSPASDNLRILTIGHEIVFSYFTISAWDLLHRSCPNFIQK